MKPRDDLTDVPGFRVGSAEDESACTGCTVVLCPPEGAVGGVDQQGGASGTRETDPLRPLHLVDRCHAVLLAGGSAFGLDAAGGVVRYLEGRGIGFPTHGGPVPIVPAAILFDLGIGRGDVRPDAQMGEAACREAERGEPVRLGNAGAGSGATIGKILGLEGAMKGGLGSASAMAFDGLWIGALVAVNPFGDVVDPATSGTIAGAREPASPADAPVFADSCAVLRARRGEPLAFRRSSPNTVLAVVATNASLDKREANILARMASVGIARAVRPAHTTLDGDTVFALAAGECPCDVNLLGSIASDLVARAIVRAALRAEPLGGLPAASQLAGKARGLRIRNGDANDGPAAASIMQGLPEWFRPESRQEMIQDLRQNQILVAELDRTIVGFLVHGPSRVYPEPGLVKIHWLAVRRDYRGRGIVHALVRALEDILRAGGGALLELMTVSDIDLYPPYADTRAFYRAIGFEEFYTDANLEEQHGAEMLHFRKRIPGRG